MSEFIKGDTVAVYRRTSHKDDFMLDYQGIVVGVKKGQVRVKNRAKIIRRTEWIILSHPFERVQKIKLI